MSELIPVTMKALIVQPNKTAKIEERPVPTIDDDEVLIRTIAVALNPTDWKHVELIVRVGTIAGCDLAGRVVKVGKDVRSLAVGDIVSTFVHGGKYKDRGAFAEYAKSPAELTWKVPDNITPEQAATVSCGSWTVGQAFYHSGRLGLVQPPAKVEGEPWFYVHGGSSSVGMYAVQVAKLAGYKVFTVASPRNFALCKSLGADVVFDYNSPDSIKKIKEITNNSIQYGIETISTKESQAFAVQVFGRAGGKLLVILPPNAEAQKARPDVKLQHTLMYTALGKEVHYPGGIYPASPKDRADMVEWIKLQTELVKQGLLKPNPMKLMDGGLGGIPTGLQYIKEGKNSAEKLVYRI